MNNLKCYDCISLAICAQNIAFIFDPKPRITIYGDVFRRCTYAKSYMMIADNFEEFKLLFLKAKGLFHDSL
jgi:hypothetical protein